MKKWIILVVYTLMLFHIAESEEDISNTKSNLVIEEMTDSYDKDGFDSSGYDINGFDRRGYNKDGLDKYGYDKDGFNDSSSIKIGSGTDTTHIYEISLKDSNGNYLENFDITGNWELGNYDFYNDELPAENKIKVMTNKNGKARVIIQENIFDSYDRKYSWGKEFYSRINIQSGDDIKYFTSIRQEKKGEKYYPTNINNETINVDLVLIPKTSIIHQLKLKVQDINGKPINNVHILGTINDNEIKDLIYSDKDGNAILNNSNFESIVFGETYTTNFKLTFEKEKYYYNSEEIAISEEWENKTINSEQLVTLYKTEDYFTKDFLNNSKYKTLREKVKSYIDLLNLKSLISNSYIPYRSVGIYKFKEKNYLEVNLKTTLVYNSLQLNQYDIGKKLYTDLIIKLLEYLVDIKDINISGINLKIEGYTRDFSNDYESNTTIIYEFIMNSNMIQKYKNKDISGQKLLDNSIILMDNDRIELKLQ